MEYWEYFAYTDDYTVQQSADYFVLYFHVYMCVY